MKRSYLFFLIPALVAPLTAAADERIFVQVPAMIDAAAPIPEAVRKECGVEMLIGSHALSAISRRNKDVQAVAAPEQAGDGKLVRLTVVAAFGHGGGAWSGPKQMTIRADLVKGGATLGSTLLTRASSRGSFGAMGFGTCNILNRVATALGKDVAVWLAKGALNNTADVPTNDVEPADGAEPAPGK